MVDPESIPRLMTAGTIEVAPLAYMRGRAQPVDTPVLTPRVSGRSGASGSATWSSGPTVDRPRSWASTRRASRRSTASRTQDGASTVACGEHLWAVTTPADKRRGKPAGVLETREMIGRLRQAHAHRYELPVVAARRDGTAGGPHRPVRRRAAAG